MARRIESVTEGGSDHPDATMRSRWDRSPPGCGSDSTSKTDAAGTAGSSTTNGDSTAVTEPESADEPMGDTLSGDATVEAMIEAGWIPAPIDGSAISDASVSEFGGSLTVKAESFDAVDPLLGYTEKQGAFSGSPPSDCFIGSGVKISEGLFMITMACPATVATATTIVAKPAATNSPPDADSMWPASAPLPAGSTIVAQNSEFTLTYDGSPPFDTLTNWLNSIGSVDRAAGDDNQLRITATSTNPDLVALLSSGNSVGSVTIDVSSGSAPGTYTIFIY